MVMNTYFKIMYVLCVFCNASMHLKKLIKLHNEIYIDYIK